VLCQLAAGGSSNTQSTSAVKAKVPGDVIKTNKIWPKETDRVEVDNDCGLEQSTKKKNEKNVDVDYFVKE
jgi:hypothetical protein